MKKRVNLINRVSALGLSFFLALGLITPAFSITANAEAVEVLNGATTIADCIMSYCASGGVAIMNETVIDEVYNVLGTSFGTVQTFVDNGLLTYSDGTFVNSGLSTSISSAINNISSIDIGALFNQTAEQNPAGVALTGASSLAGIAGSVASTGFLPVTAGVAISGYCGFQIGNIIANMIGLYGEPIWAGQDITSKDMLESVPAGTRGFSYKDSSGNKYYRYVANAAGYVFYVENVSPFMWFYGADLTGRKQLYTIKVRADSGTITTSYQNVNFSNGSYGGQSSNNYTDYTPPISKTFSTLEEYSTYRDNLKNGTEPFPEIYSPDIIGSKGNVQGNYENGEYTVPDALPQIDPSNNSINPSGLTLEDWLRFANDAKGNTGSGQPEANKNIFDDIIDALKGINPTPTPDPTPDPNPGGETYPVPGPVPDNTPVPDPEYQPETKPQPQYTEKPTENETDITEGDPWTTPDLLDKFPFCIPRDVYRVFTKLDSGARSAPHIQWRFNPNNKIDYTFDIDFSEWDSIATLLRTLELLGFIVALAVATRKMILS